MIHGITKLRIRRKNSIVKVRNMGSEIMSLWVEVLLNGMSGVIGKTFFQALLVKATEEQCVASLPSPQVLAYGLDQIS